MYPLHAHVFRRTIVNQAVKVGCPDTAQASYNLKSINMVRFIAISIVVGMWVCSFSDHMCEAISSHMYGTPRLPRWSSVTYPNHASTHARHGNGNASAPLVLFASDYGAVGDNKTDNTGPLTAALTAAHKLDGAEVVMGQGTLVLIVNEKWIF